MKNKKIYLHMGFHKTASSSFQATCSKNKDNLFEQGFLFPLFSGTFSPKVENHSTPIYSCFTPEIKHYAFYNVIGMSDKEVDYNKNAFLEQLNIALSSEKNLILSGEDISRLPEVSLSKLLTHLKSYNFDVVPIAYVRSPYELDCSNKQQIVKSGIHANFLETSYYSQKEQITKLNKIFGESITYIAFKQACKHKNGPSGYLLEFMGVDDTNITFTNINKGVGNLKVRMQNVLNAKQSRFENGKLNEKWQDITLIGDDYFTNKFLLTESEYRKIKQYFDVENDFLRNNLGEEFCDTDIFHSNSNLDVEEFANYLLNTAHQQELECSEELKMDKVKQAIDEMNESNLTLEEAADVLQVNFLNLNVWMNRYGPTSIYDDKS